MASDVSSTKVTTWSASAPPVNPGQGLSINRYGPDITDQSSEGSSFDLGHILRIATKHRWVIGGAVAAALVIGVVISLLMTPIYMASVTIETAAETVQITNDQSLQPQAMQDPSLTATYVELLGSRSLAERIVEELDLADDPTFVGDASAQSLFSRASKLLSKGNSTESTVANAIEARKRFAIERVLKNTSAKSVKTSRLLMVSYTDTNPERAQRIANALGAGFINANLDRRFDATSYARKFLENQLQQIKLKLEDSERKVVTYADKEKLVNLDNKQSLLSAQLESLNTALAAATIARSNAEELWLSVKDATDYSEIPTDAFAGDNNGSSTSVINQLRNSRSQLMADYQEKALTFKPGFPAMVALKSRIDDVDRQISDEVAKTKNTIRSSYELAVQREQGLQSGLENTKKALLDARNRGVEYTMLQREADTNRTLYDGLLQRFKEISTVGGLASNGLSIVDEADLPTVPTSPKKTLNVALALVAGLVAGFGAAFVLEYFDNTIKTPDQMEAVLGIPVLGLIPQLPKNVPLPTVLDDPHSAFSESYRSARTALQFSTDRGVPKTLVITSARPSEGKTTSANMLARMFSQIGLRVLIIDADLRNPSVHKVFDLENSAGLSNYLTGSAEADELMRSVDSPNITVMTSGPIPPNPAELLSSAHMLTLLTVLTARFDLIVIDSPPVMGLADALLLSSIAEGTLLICASGETPINLAKGAIKRISMVNSLVLGGILTKFNSKRAGYGYAYYGYDYYGYGSTGEAAALERPANQDASV
ncbi:GumC family protein [Xanthobacter wiegelii]|uniref:GumC family protein n=1 Tax=Xanthobacter wiegelii TaxID=3119913 RepID=UPI0037264CBB